MKNMLFIVFVACMLQACTCAVASKQVEVRAAVEKCSVNGVPVSSGERVAGIQPDYILIALKFSEKVSPSEFVSGSIRINGEASDDFRIFGGGDPNTVLLKLRHRMQNYTLYDFEILPGKTLGVDLERPFTFEILTALSPVQKFPTVTDEELLTMVQRNTFRYFWDYAHPVSGLARERTGSGDIVTSGGSGFGLMAFPVAVERGFVTREEAAERLGKIVDFLSGEAERFHGAFAHWMDGATGRALPFSPKDNGGDIVETALLMQGLLTVAQYFDSEHPQERKIRNTIRNLWEEVEWDWYLNGKDVLYWHWSPEYEWDAGLAVSGWNEALIAYVLAASSPTHPISKAAYDEGWARSGAMVNGDRYFDVMLPLGPEYGGPLFFAHYSFLGLDPRGLEDPYADYWEQNVSHTKINHRYCVRNPKGWYGYGYDVWGLTASDVPGGYAVSSPTEDYGTIAPTAALSSFPYTPDESLKALRYYYYVLGDRIFGE